MNQPPLSPQEDQPPDPMPEPYDDQVSDGIAAMQAFTGCVLLILLAIMGSCAVTTVYRNVF